MIKVLEDIIKPKYQDDGTTLEGHIEFKELSDKIDALQKEVESTEEGKVFTLRIKEGLAQRFEKATRFEGLPKSKVLRSLIEFYIVMVEEEMKEGIDKIREILSEPEIKQMALVMELSDDEKLQYLKLKQEFLEKKALEDSINKQGK